MKFCFLLSVSFLLCTPWAVAAPVYSIDASVESRNFYQTGKHSNDQPMNPVSVSMEPQINYSWNNDRDNVTFLGFARLDSADEERSHWDVRQLDWTKSTESFEFRVGVRKVFWGVIEGLHLVDIINQTDLIENFDGEQKLGQPMANVAWVGGYGTLDIFILPYFRERTHPGEEGRFRQQIPIAKVSVYESSEKESHMDFAARFTKSYDWVDVGLSIFQGTSRDPRYVTTLRNSRYELIPHYDQIRQTGLNLQGVWNAWLFKFEGIYRDGKNITDYHGTAYGVEYTFSNIKNSGHDLGVLAEYYNDSRNKNATTPFEDDILTGLRWAWNDVSDTQLLAGVIADRDADTRMINIEGSRNWGNHVKWTLESRNFLHVPGGDFLKGFEKDSYTEVRFTYSY